MFDVHGDEISFRGIRFATIDGKAWPGLRAEAEGELLNGPDGWVTQEDADEQASQEYNKAVSDGEESGKEAGRAEAEKEYESKLEAIEEEKYNEGRADGLQAAANAADVAKVDALLSAIAKASGTLGPVLNGVRDAGENDPLQFRKRPAKIGELKTQMRLAITILQSAAATYKAG